jgi:hypothetical protein
MRTAGRTPAHHDIPTGLWLTAGSLLALVSGTVWFTGDAGHLRVLLSLVCTALLLVLRAGGEHHLDGLADPQASPGAGPGQIQALVPAGGARQAKRVCGCEVLARWHLPDGRIRGAARFIPLAEQVASLSP